MNTEGMINNIEWFDTKKLRPLIQITTVSI